MDYGILSLTPAILAILLAILTKNVIVSLAIAIFVGPTILCGWNPMAGFLEVTHTHGIKDKIFKFEECIQIYTKGCANAMFMCIVLTLAWSLSSVTKALDTTSYLIHISEGFLVPSIFPLVMSFATGTSWGAMSVLMPLGLPVAISMNASLPLIVAAIVGGGLFGDHCSPISDTTVLVSIGSCCDHVDPFETQLPYAVTVATVCAVMILLTGWITSPIMLWVSLIILTALIFGLHKFAIQKHSYVKTPEK